jgi:hypothetical protein
MKALTPDDMFNQKGLTWRSISTLAQFATVEQEEVLGILDEHFQGMISVRPNGKHPENGPLVALNEHIPNEPADAPPEGAPQVVIMGGNAVAAAIEGVAAEEAPIPIVDGDGVPVPGDAALAEAEALIEEIEGEQDHE